ncbi:hypothetical protein PG997_010483 [Apiospora hydei]|uniref:Uncharacterized protein n=1 Tax=Apiospora hydei TaxID=1337664 RepID=A0ABR1VX38_9PEZI
MAPAETQSSAATKMSLGLQRLAEACPEFARLNLVEQLSEKTPTGAGKPGGLKLSWPKASNTRRAVVAKTVTSSVPPKGTHPTSTSGAHMINVTCGDIAVHYRYHTGSVPLVESVASRSLSTFGQDPAQLGQILLRTAHAGDGTPFGSAVQQSLLAFSSAHRHGAHARGNEHKIAALKAMADISGCEIDVTEAVQHVAAGMLLCSYEMQHSTCTTGHWLSYLIGIQDIIRVTGLDTIQHHPDLTMLLDWVYYYSVLARFSRQHWQRKEFVGVQLAPMRLHRESWRIRNLPVTFDIYVGADSEAKLELYRLAMLVYLNRASENILNQASKTQQQVDKGFSILSGLDFCDQQFPVFILGCEARSDWEREAVLGLIQRTEEHGTCREFNHVKLLLQSLWAQDDLAFGRDRKYWDQLSDAISRCAVLPTFV